MTRHSAADGDRTTFTSRRRRTGVCALIALGAFTLTAAILLPTYAVPKLEKIPLDIEANTLSVAPGSSLVDITQTSNGHAATETGVPLIFRVYVTVQDPSDADVVTLQAATSMNRADRPDNDPISASVDRVTLDRSTGVPVADPPGFLQTVQNKPPDSAVRKGFQYKFPFDTERTSYPYFDTIARVTRPIDYTDDDRVEGGMQLYHFHQKLDPINLRIGQPDAKLTLAASNWGIPGGDQQVTFDLWYENERDLWVEPVSGAIVAVEEHLHRYLARSIDDPHALTTLDARTKFGDTTLQHLTSVAKEARSNLLLVNRYGPIGLAGIGLLSFAAAAVLTRRSGGRVPEPGFDSEVAAADGQVTTSAASPRS
ncbi:DUF3068 domain-containing protein [Antrihabitans stalactiti]|jgi:hypothetical protein|uniref:DUF3068 domain-containing protein n=1 Tax=Antrihabitans stalactiti TaxID=2584121 RepID=A0A848KMX5_9NOCA|nr:DUF3068 domain-containing protein [Antrihabitans stalactiti]NMN99298.1 DUF3068 domain-containing protein [Antrihabitans stalactiti]